MKQRVLILTQWFDPEPTFKGLAFAKELVRQGFEVSVITGFPNYPGGRLYAGYKIRPVRREVLDGVRVLRVALFPSHDKSALRRALNYVSFAFSSLLCGLLLGRRSDVIYVYHPPLTVGVTGALISLICRRPFVYDVQDMWPDTLRATGMVRSRFVLDCIATVCGWVYRRASRIAVLSPGFKHLLTQRGVPPEKIEVIYNWADREALVRATGSVPQGSLLSRPRLFKVLFAGNMGHAQALDSVLDAADLHQSRASRVVFIFVGAGVDCERLRKRAAGLMLRNVEFLPSVPMSEVGTYLAAADVLLVHLRDDPLFAVTIPSKTQAYMAAGKAIVLAVRGDAAELLLASGGGVAIPPENPEALASAVGELASLPLDALAQMGHKNRDYYESHLSIEHGVDRFGRVFRQVIPN